ncbi:putative NADH-flavin reductase [Sediminihabitans luteus]|uniref:Putative NADH-flavin reductase n=1 Tax=Sediminihabitans luteus TaxID=1138585 RepID=A0A2M9CC07_9CELL|nr:NAD(P)-binding oxidoreductase [Sediminihabitans luteus]PJJ68573.1 putative NADH-flavin reductase [Sediminihabitans luteus]GII99911.1 NAD-dependent dehydratase [Sediminihabitans luteus]
MKIALVGAHGKVGQIAIGDLTAAGHEVTGIIRSPEQSDQIAGLGAQPLVLDVATASADDVAAGLRGHDAVVWSAGAGGGGDAERTYSVDRDAAIRTMDAAASEGVRRYVMVSFIGAVHDHGVPRDDPFFAYADAKVAADDHLRGTDLDWAILGPGTLTDDATRGAVRVLADGDPVPEDSSTARATVAAVITAVLGSGTVAGVDARCAFVRFTDGDVPIA